MKIPGERGAKTYYLGNTYMPPEWKSTGKDIQRKFGGVAADAQKYERQREVVLQVGE